MPVELREARPGRFMPLLGALMRRRAPAVALALLPLLIALGHAAGVRFWHCPFRAVTGLSCPGCGMTHAVVLLGRGRLAESLRWHPGAAIALAGWALLAARAVLPEGMGRRLTARVWRAERRTGFTTLALAALVLYGLGRLAAELAGT